MATYTYGPADLSAIKTACAQGGHTIYLRPGKYTIDRSGSNGWTIGSGTKLIGLSPGTSNNPTLKSSVGAIIVMGSTRGYADNCAMLYMNHADNVLFENIAFTAYKFDGEGLGGGHDVMIYGDYCDNLEIRKCFFAFGPLDFIKLRHGTNSRIHHNLMWFPGHECLYLLGCSTTTFSYNTCKTRTNSACRVSYTCNNIDIHHNDITGARPSYTSFTDGDSGKSYTIAGGYSHPGIELDATGGNYEVYQNKISDISGCGIWIFSKTSKQNGLKIHHNTFTNTGLGGCNYCNAAIHIYQADEVTIYNNRFVGSSGYGRSLHCYRGYNIKDGVYNYFGDPIADTYNISFTNNVGALSIDIEIVNSLASASSKHVVSSSSNTTGSGGGYTDAIGWTAGTTGTTPPPTTTTPVQPDVKITSSVSSLIQPSSGTLKTATITWEATGCTSAQIVRYEIINGAWTAVHQQILTLSGTGYNTGSYTVSPTVSSRYAIFGYNNNSSPTLTDTGLCEITVTTQTILAPTRSSFYASKSPITNVETISLIATGLTNTTSASVEVESAAGVMSTYAMDILGTTATCSNVSFSGTGSRLCRLKLVGPGGTNTQPDELHVTVNAPPTVATPIITFTASYTEITENDEIELTWNVVNATSVTITIHDSQTPRFLDIGGTNVLSGTKKVSLSETTTFELDALNHTTLYGDKFATYEITITVYPRVILAPVIRLRTDTQSIDIDQSARIYWSTENTTELTCNQGVVIPDPLSGYVDVSPLVDTTYTFFAEGPDGYTTVNITIYVNTSDIVGAFVVSPPIINNGESATLAWMTRYGKDAYIDNSIGLMDSAARGTYVVTPSADTTYTLLISGSMGTLEKTCDVTVLEALPSGSISAQFSIDNPLITVGETSTISWLTQNADVMSCGQEIGFVQTPSGSLPVQPGVTTDYNFVLAKDFDSIEYTIPIYVVDNYELLMPAPPSYAQEYIDMTGKRIYVSGGQSTSDTSYTWDIDTNAGIRPNPDNEMITFAYDENGYYMITLTNIDRDGNITKQTVRANVVGNE